MNVDPISATDTCYFTNFQVGFGRKLTEGSMIVFGGGKILFMCQSDSIKSRAGYS